MPYINLSHGKIMTHKKITVAILIIFAAIELWSQEYGLVLSGGGAKGAYEVGVWKALKEYGIAQKITAMSGSSVGGLNAALFSCIDNTETIEKIWRDHVPLELTPKDGEWFLSQRGLANIIDILPLYKLRTNIYPEVTVTCLHDISKDVPVIGFLLQQMKAISPLDHAYRFVLNSSADDSKIKSKLLATAAMPFITSPVYISDDGYGGRYYSDGGDELHGGDNVPITPIVDNYNNIRNIIIVYLSDLKNLEKRINAREYTDYNLIEIIPTIDLGNLVNGVTRFDAAYIDLLIRQGYEDAASVLERKGFSKVEWSWWFHD